MVNTAGGRSRSGGKIRGLALGVLRLIHQGASKWRCRAVIPGFSLELRGAVPQGGYGGRAGEREIDAWVDSCTLK